MKKINLSVVAMLVAGSMLGTSCVGSFSLFNKYAKWQMNMTSSKIVNGIVGIILLPFVGSVCMLVDAVVLNTIEFWSGNNPVAENTKTVTGEDGRKYLVKTSQKGYEVTAPDGQVTLFLHDEATDSWSISQNGQTRRLFSYNADGTIEACLPTGQTMTVSNDQQGLTQLQQSIGTAAYYAQR